MIEQTPNEILPMPLPPMLATAAKCACCGAAFERSARDTELCAGCHQAANGQGTPGPIIPQTFGQRTVTIVVVLAVALLVVARVAMLLHSVAGR